MASMLRCGTDHEMVLSPVDLIESHDGRVNQVVECTVCGREYVVDDDGSFVPVSPSIIVDNGAWDGHDHGTGLFADPHWARSAEPRG